MKTAMFATAIALVAILAAPHASATGTCVGWTCTNTTTPSSDPHTVTQGNSNASTNACAGNVMIIFSVQSYAYGCNQGNNATVYQCNVNHDTTSTARDPPQCDSDVPDAITAPSRDDDSATTDESADESVEG